MAEMFREVVEPHTGYLLFRFDPERDLIEIQRRGIKTLIDLGQFRDVDSIDNDGETVIISTY